MDKLEELWEEFKLSIEATCNEDYFTTHQRILMAEIDICIRELGQEEQK